ncbi:hypothetical protein ABZS66_23725 [Dactylosporangium sp. NPDC005572]|uniref:hypothetical protein n=1 Tax=Dactylosporangium sp. NPDC005572 TaxID=3156889 RepID=UPI0033A93B1A
MRRRGVARHPIIKYPLALRISRLRLRTIITACVLTLAVLVVALAVALHFLDRDRPTVRHAMRLVWAEIVNPGGLIAKDGQSPLYYAVAAGLSFLAVLVPIFLLGSFAFKLFLHDPLVWRPTVSLQDQAGAGAILALRCYNGTNVPLVSITFKVLALIRSTGSPASLDHVPLQILAGEQRVDAREFELSPPAEPFTVRVPLAAKGARTRSAREVFDLPDIDLQGRPANKRRVTIAIVASGTYTVTGTTFVSHRSYELSRDLLLGHFQSIEVDPHTPPHRWDGWPNFDGNRDIYLFVYDEAVDPAVLESSAGVALGPAVPVQATLRGWVRDWTVATGDPATPTRLGLTRAPGAECNGVVFPVISDVLERTDESQPWYRRIDVTDDVDWPGRPDPCTVYCYVAAAGASAAAPPTLAAAEAVERAFAELGDEALRTYRATTGPQ